MLNNTLRIGRSADAELRAHWSLILLILLVLVLLWPLVGALWALAGALLAVGSLTVYLLAQILAAHSQGIPVRVVVLWGLGSMSELADEPAQPLNGLLVAIGGPIASLLLGAVCWLIAGLLPVGSPMPLRTLLEAALLINLLIALHNLLPIGALDGAKLLRAVLQLAPWPNTDRFALMLVVTVGLCLVVYTAVHERWGLLAVALAAPVLATLIDPTLRYLGGMALTALVRPADYQLFYRLDFARALALYDRALARRPHDPQLYQRRAQARQELGDRNGALADLDRAVALAPGMWLLLRERATVCLRLGAFARARADYTRALALHPHDPLCYEGRIYAAVQQHDYAAALADYNALIGLEPNRAATYAARAYVRHRANDAAGAYADLNEALTRAPDLAAVHTARGLILLECGDHNGARNAFEQAVTLAPHDPAALNNRGFLNRIEGRTDEALADFNRAIALDPGLHYLYVSRGELHTRQGQHTLALVDVEYALELMPDYAEALYQRAALHYVQGDLVRARADAERALMLDPELLRLPEGLIEATLTGQLAWALQLADWATVCLPGSPLPDLWRGDALRANGQPQASRAAYTRALARAPDDPDLIQRREAVLRRSGQATERTSKPPSDAD